MLIGTFCRTVKEAQRRFKLFLGGDDSAIHPNARQLVYKICLTNGGEKEYDGMLQLNYDHHVEPSLMIN